MKHYLLFFFYVFLNCTKTPAAIKTDLADTSINKSNYKHSRQYFLENYGKDDSTKALVNYFFAKREKALIETVIPAVAGGVAAVLVARLSYSANNPTSGKGSGYAGLVIVPAFLVVLYSSVTLIDGQIKWLVFNRRKLLVILISYNSGKSLPKKTTHRKAFKYELESLKKLK